jgi:hypothetical protein
MNRFNENVIEFDLTIKSDDPVFDQVMDKFWTDNFDEVYPPYSGSGGRSRASHRDQFMILAWNLYKLWTDEGTDAKLAVRLNRSTYARKKKCPELSVAENRMLNRQIQQRDNPYHITALVVDVFQLLYRTGYIDLMVWTKGMKPSRIWSQDKLCKVFSTISNK